MVGESSFERFAKQIVVVMVALLVLLPVYWMVNMSFKGEAEFAARPPTFVVATADDRELLRSPGDAAVLSQGHQFARSSPSSRPRSP